MSTIDEQARYGTGHEEQERVEHPVDADTRLREVSEGTFEGQLSDRWNALGGVVNGGYLVAVCVRVLHAVLPHPKPLVVSTFFLRAGAPGPVEVRTEVARQGRRYSTGEARLYQNGKEVVRTTATFASSRDGAETGTVLAEAPQLPSPESSFDAVGDTHLPGVTMIDQIEIRYPELPGWRCGQPSGDSRATFWMRFKHGRAADALTLPLLVDAAPPTILELDVAGSATLELTTHVRADPAPGWLSCRVTTRFLFNGHHEEDFEIWDSRGVLVAQARQLAMVRDR